MKQLMLRSLILLLLLLPLRQSEGFGGYWNLYRCLDRCDTGLRNCKENLNFSDLVCEFAYSDCYLNCLQRFANPRY